MDFGSTFGSGSVEIQFPHLSYYYWLDLGEMRDQFTGFGFRTPTYRDVEWPEFPKYEAAGRWEAASFEPHAWKNDYPNPAFVRMTDRDAFWAAKILMRFTEEELLAIVKTGEFSDPDVEAYFHEVLVERQQKTGGFYLDRVNPLDGFVLSSGGLAWTNLAEDYGFASTGTEYEVFRSVYDNGVDDARTVGNPVRSARSSAALPDAVTLGDETYLMAEIRSDHPEFPAWASPVRVYLRAAGGGFEIVGIER